MFDITAGFCYLSVVKEEHRDVVADVVGLNPPVGVFMHGVEAYQLDDEKLLECGWYGGYDVDLGQNVYHIGLVGKGERIASVASVLIAEMGTKAPVSSGVVRRATVCSTKVDRDCNIGRDFETRAQVPVSKELVALSGVVDSASSVAAVAVDGKCVVDLEDTLVRVADSKFLRAIVSGQDPGILDGAMRPDWFSRLGTLGNVVDRADFGSGYCYLDAVEHDLLWHCARLLGPNPLVSSVANVLLWAGKVSAKALILDEVGKGIYHLSRDKNVKGVDVRAGRKLVVALLALAAREPTARIGADPLLLLDGDAGLSPASAVKVKAYCSACDCMVVVEGHDARCRPKPVKGVWSDKRKQAWFGDSIHRVDVQLAMSLTVSVSAQWEINAQLYTSNAAQAAYMRLIGLGRDGQSDHALGTDFEARYTGAFRLQYLCTSFPDCWRAITRAWVPPLIMVNQAGLLDLSGGDWKDGLLPRWVGYAFLSLLLVDSVLTLALLSAVVFSYRG